MVRRGSGFGASYAEDDDDDRDQDDEEYQEDDDNEDDDDYGSSKKKKSPAKKKKSPAKKKGAKKSPKKSPKKTPRGKISQSKTPKRILEQRKRSKNVSYADDSESEEESEPESEAYSDSEEEDEVQGGYYYNNRNKSSKSPKKKRKLEQQKKESFPPVSEMVTESIRALRDPPRKGSTLGAIKETIALNWPLNMKMYDSKIKKYMTKAIDSGDIIQVRGPGFRGRFTVPGLKVKPKKKAKKLGKKFDEDEEEYNPQKTARDEERERDQEELERKREERRIWEAKKAEEKAKMPKKPAPQRRQVWEVEAIKGMKTVNGQKYYLVKFENWGKPQWEPENNVTGCDKAIEDFLKMDAERKAEEEERKKREEEEGAYDVKRVLEVKFVKGDRREFLIRWVGHGPQDDSWEPEENLNCPELIKKFMSTWEKRVQIEDKRLREAPKKVERLAFARNKRQSKRGDGFRVTYDGMDE